MDPSPEEFGLEDWLGQDEDAENDLRALLAGMLHRYLRRLGPESGLRELAAELLALTKMNVNNAAFSDGTPITLAFSRRVSEVLKQVGPDMPVRAEYSFYM